ncbi:zonular occludens toxin [Ectothiorhodospiraceae bacterium WFHF3C12]|nr:zonular occludens toxin [Ectothiorhodospiraceae bacterium WFHF3C12]
MLTLVTGTPGAGKSLHVIDQLKHETTRPIYYHGIEGLALPWIELEDPKRWPELVPDNAIVILDEVQQHFGPRGPRQEIPEGVSALETHRHRGIDLYFITQHPTLLDHHARRLVGEHIHLKRNFGAPFSTLYHGNEVMDVKDRADLARAAKTQWRHPKDTFKLYKSAEVHTHKFRLPKKLLWALPAIALVAGGVWVGYQQVYEGGIADTANAQPANPTHQRAITNPTPGAGQPHTAQPVTPADWRERMDPRVRGLPFTAPIYAKAAEPKTVPQIKGCVSNADQCTCYTQQATRIPDMPERVCRQIVKHGYFNFLKEDEQDGNEHDTKTAQQRYSEALAIYEDIRRQRAQRW